MKQTERIVFETDTEYDHYEVVDRIYEGRPARVLFSGAHRSAQSGIGLDDNPDLLFDYNQRILEVANALYPKRILVIGGGAFTLPMALGTALPDAVVDVVELDEGLPPIAEQYFGLQIGEQLRVFCEDGREFLERTAETYDLIVIDVFQNLSVPAPFRTVEWIKLLHGHLTAKGAVAMNIIATYQGRHVGLIKSQIAGYSEQFNSVDIFPAAYGLTSWLPQNMVLVAQKDPLEDLPQYVRYKQFELLPTEASDALHDVDIN